MWEIDRSGSRTARAGGERMGDARATDARTPSPLIAAERETVSQERGGISTRKEEKKNRIGKKEMKGGKRRRDSHNQSAQQDEPVETEKQNEHLGKWGIGMEWQREREEEGVKAGRQSVTV